MVDPARDDETCARVMIRATTRDDMQDSSLAARLQTRIASDGPLSVEAFMDACLSDAASGAYASRQPIGLAGDFITAPEISQIFGELIGLWAVAVWQSMGEPKPVTVAELGPGRGTLMADALRAWRGAPQFLDDVSVALIETSPVMVEAQRKALKDALVPLRWYQKLDPLPDAPLIVLANEFIDALPIRQFVRRGGAWRERLVRNDDRGGFAFAEATAAAPDDHTRPAPHDAPEGAVFETRPAAEKLLREFGRRAERVPLATLIVDYGHEQTGLRDTLQAVRGHRFADPLADPGEADLTAHVDFTDLKQCASALGLKTCGPLPQGEFLLKLGLGERRERLLQRATPAQASSIVSGATRLVDPMQMGMLFKVLALTSAELAPPPPFGADHFTLFS
jgi:NADH dehydrogenase [ubiquinone] 1 alpha subcomplex assembly factor 7